jgi:predicted DNA-binding antitoxin AbrB/MazE fold protein
MIKTEAVYENGVLRPLTPLPLSEKQTVAVTISEPQSWLDRLIDVELIEECRKDSQEAPSLEEMRALLSGVGGSLSDAVVAERDESRY